MSAQAEASKVVAYAATGTATGNTSVAKVVAYMVLVPGEIEAGDTSRQGHVHAFTMRRS